MVRSGGPIGGLIGTETFCFYPNEGGDLCSNGEAGPENVLGGTGESCPPEYKDTRFDGNGRTTPGWIILMGYLCRISFFSCDFLNSLSWLSFFDSFEVEDLWEDLGDLFMTDTFRMLSRPFWKFRRELLRSCSFLVGPAEMYVSFDAPIIGTFFWPTLHLE